MDSTDPYATAKGNLRDTVKWMATTFAALAAVVLAGSPFSGFGSLALDGLRFYVATAGLIGAAVLLILAWHEMVFLLRPDAVFPSQLRDSFKPDPLDRSADAAEVRAVTDDFKKHKQDLLPSGLNAFEDLERAVEKYWEQANDRNLPENVTKAAHERWKGYQDNVSMVVNYAAFFRLHHRVVGATPRVTKLGVGALVFLAVFAWAANPAKGDLAQKVTVLQPFDIKGPSSPPEGALPQLQPILFELGKAEIDAAGLKAVAKAREFLRANPAAGLLLFAHTDTLGARPINRDLARRRGDVVRRLLVNEGGLSPARIFVAELPKSDLPELTQEQIASTENRAVELLAIRLPQRKPAAGPSGASVPGSR